MLLVGHWYDDMRKGEDTASGMAHIGICGFLTLMGDFRDLERKRSQEIQRPGRGKG